MPRNTSSIEEYLSPVIDKLPKIGFLKMVSFPQSIVNQSLYNEVNNLRQQQTRYVIEPQVLGVFVSVVDILAVAVAVVFVTSLAPTPAHEHGHWELGLEQSCVTSIKPLLENETELSIFLVRWQWCSTHPDSLTHVIF